MCLRLLTLFAPYCSACWLALAIALLLVLLCVSIDAAIAAMLDAQNRKEKNDRKP